MRNIVLWCSLMGLCCLLVNCGKEEPPRPPAKIETTKTEFTKHRITDAEMDKEVTCPVMGTKFKIRRNTLATEYKGKVYYFCCPGCPEAFRDNPDKYLHKEGE